MLESSRGSRPSCVTINPLLSFLAAVLVVYRVAVFDQGGLDERGIGVRQDPGAQRAEHHAHGVQGGARAPSGCGQRRSGVDRKCRIFNICRSFPADLLLPSTVCFFCHSLMCILFFLLLLVVKNAVALTRPILEASDRSGN